MKNVAPYALLAALAFASLTGCPKRTETNVAGTDEEQLDRHLARLEELRARLTAEGETIPCNERCSMATEVCDRAQKVCTLAGKDPDRLQVRCVAANEDCARFNDACSSCRR